MPSEHDLKSLVDRHDRELVELKSEFAHVKNAVDDIKSITSETTKHIAELSQAVTSRNSTNLSDLKDWLQSALLVFALAGGIVSGIVYISSNANSAQLALMQYKLDKLNRSFGWVKRDRTER